MDPPEKALATSNGKNKVSDLMVVLGFTRAWPPAFS
jgi:hypothetical protein